MQTRQDGRPEAYDIDPQAVTHCYTCMTRGNETLYHYKQIAFLIVDGEGHAICLKHLKQYFPDVVIVNPNEDFYCRDLKGTEPWREERVN